jgi:hypothetical protein
VPRSREQLLTEWDRIRAKIADGCTNSGPRDWFENVMDEQDHIIADLVRETVRLKYFEDTYHAHQRWNDQAKRDAGFHPNTSFDDVWAKALKAYLASKPTTEN